MEVIEHVTEPRAFVSGLAARLAEGGLLILSTPNRTFRARLLMLTLGEGTGRIPTGTHDCDTFLTPDELCAFLAEAGLEVLDVRGLAWSPARGFSPPYAMTVAQGQQVSGGVYPGGRRCNKKQ